MTYLMTPGSLARRAVHHGLLLTAAICLLAAQSVHAQDADRAELDTLLERAELALQAGQYRSAAEDYVAAAALSTEPQVAQTATRVAYTYGFNELGLDAAERWQDLEPDSEEAVLYLAQLNLRLGSLRRSAGYFEDLLENGEGEPDQRLLSLIPILSEEDPVQADRLMRRLARPYKNSAYALYASAVMALQAGDGEAAQERAERAIELRPEWIRPKLLYARALMLSGEDEAAIDFAARIVGDSPQPDPEARLELAIMYLSVGRDDDALSQVNQVLLEQPSRTDALRMLAIINFRLGNLDAASDDFQDLLASGRYTMDALYYLARIADSREDYTRAIGLYSQITRGQNVVPAQRRASALIAQEGEAETAIEHLRNFAEKYPSYAIEMVAAEAQLMVSLDRYDDALAVYDRIAEYRPDSEGVMLGRAELLVRMDRVDAAIEQYRKAVDMYPDSANALNALGYTLADKTSEYREASRLIRKALKLEPNSPAIIDSWGWVLYRLGRHEEALEQLRRAYRDYPDGEVAAHIVEVLWVLERNDEARDMLERAELESPDHPLLKDIRERAFPADPEN